MNEREQILSAYEQNFKVVLEVLNKTFEIAATVKDYQMVGYLNMVGAQVNILLQAVSAAKEQTEEPEEEDKSYDLMDVWKRLGGQSE